MKSCGGYLPPGAWRDDEAGQFVSEFIERLPLSDGSGSFRLQNWQRECVEEFYGTLTADDVGREIRQYQFMYLEVPKKNGKTELAAALGLYHLLADGEERPEVYCVAADRENAGICFSAALYMIDHTPALKKMRDRGILKVVESQRTIRHRPSGGVMKVLSSEAYSKHGYKPSCVIFDELHAQPNRDLWDVMTFGAGDARRQPVWLVLTTAGDDPDRTSIGWEVHRKAMDILRARGQIPAALDENGVPLPCQDNPLWLPVIYGLSALSGDDPERSAELNIYDEQIWRRCNPSLGVTVPMRVVRAEAADAKKSEAAEKLFRWLRLNQWISVKSVGWIPLTVYDKTQWNREEWKGLNVLERRQAAREYLRGMKCYGGLDLSKSTDLTAFVLLFPPQPGLNHWVALFWAWRPEEGTTEAERRDRVPYRDWERAGFLDLCPGDIVDYGQVERTIWDAAAQFDIRAIGVDPHMAWTLTSRLMEPEDGQPGITVITIGQNMLSLSPPMKKLERLLRTREMLHEHNTCARWNFGNVRCAVDGNENIKPIKNKSTGRIDIAVAWIIAMAAAMNRETEGPGLLEVLESGQFTF